MELRRIIIITLQFYLIYSGSDIYFSGV